jgi:hypothetical protein
MALEIPKQLTDKLDVDPLGLPRMNCLALFHGVL